VIEQVEIQAKYQGYIERQQDEVSQEPGERGTRFPGRLRFQRRQWPVREVQQKLAQQRPQTLGQASRIQGMTPAAISILLVCLKRGESDGKRATARAAGS
jgi:tRNA uridine 5-carboxymethylaminomethyl modification enzyme